MAGPASGGMFPHPGQGGVPPMAGVRYYGYYSPAFRGISRGKRKETEDDGVPCILEDVPEPAGMLLLGSGLFCIAVIRKKFKKS